MTIVTVKQVQWVVMDLNGTLATRESKLMSNDKRRFYKNKLSDYVNDNNLWHRKKGDHKSGSLKFDYNALRLMQQRRMQAKTQDPREPLLPDNKSATKDRVKQEKDVRGALLKFINYNLDKNREYIGLFLVNMVNWGIDKNFYATPVYDEVRDVLEKWRKRGLKLALKVNQNANFERWLKTNKGNLRPLFAMAISPYPEAGRGEKKNEEKEKNYAVMATKLEVQPANILYLTREETEARLARQSGLQVVLIARKDYDPNFQRELTKAEVMKKEKGLERGSNETLPEEEFKSGGITEDGSSDLTDLPSLVEAGNTEEAAHEMTSAFKNLNAAASQITAEGIAEFPVVFSLNEINFA